MEVGPWGEGDDAVQLCRVRQERLAQWLARHKGSGHGSSVGVLRPSLELVHSCQPLLLFCGESQFQTSFSGQSHLGFSSAAISGLLKTSFSAQPGREGRLLEALASAPD